jgi:hypothetical protein
MEFKSKVIHAMVFGVYMTSCSPIGGYQYFGGIYCPLHPENGGSNEHLSDCHHPEDYSSGKM